MDGSHRLERSLEVGVDFLVFRGILGGIFRRGRGGEKNRKRTECSPSERVERGATDVRDLDETGKAENETTSRIWAMKIGAEATGMEFNVEVMTDVWQQCRRVKVGMLEWAERSRAA